VGCKKIQHRIDLVPNPGRPENNKCDKGTGHKLYDFDLEIQKYGRCRGGLGHAATDSPQSKICRPGNADGDSDPDIDSPAGMIPLPAHSLAAPVIASPQKTSTIYTHRKPSIGGGFGQDARLEGAAPVADCGPMLYSTRQHFLRRGQVLSATRARLQECTVGTSPYADVTP